MKSTGYDRRASKLCELYNARREGLTNCYCKVFAGAGADVDDALGTALEYTTKRLLVKPSDFGADDFDRLMNWKMGRLVKDVIKATGRTHGRRSVKASVYFDDDSAEDEGRSTSLMDRVSLARHAEWGCREDEENRFLIMLKAIECVLKENGTSERDYTLFDRCLFCAADRKALAAEFGTSVSNVNRICCECSQRALRLASQIRARYYQLLATQGLEAA